MQLQMMEEMNGQDEESKDPVKMEFEQDQEGSRPQAGQSGSRDPKQRRLTLAEYEQ